MKVVPPTEVRLKLDRPDIGVRPGMRGMIVEVDGVSYEVDVLDSDGRTVAALCLSRDQLDCSAP